MAHRVTTLRNGGRRGLVGDRRGYKRCPDEEQRRLKMTRLAGRILNRDMTEEIGLAPEKESRPTIVVNECSVVSVGRDGVEYYA